MTNSLSMIEFSYRDAAALASFLSQLIGVPINEGASSAYAQLSPDEPLPKWLFIQREPAGQVGSVLLTLLAPDLKRDLEAAVPVGATSHGIQSQNGFVWATLSDPEGNRFTLNAPPPQ